MALNICFIIFIIALIAFIFSIFEAQSKKTTSEKDELRNFPFFHNGKLYWYSRSVAVSHFVFAKDKDDNWCVLANKRGLGTPDYCGFWNVPCGYLDFNETAEEAAQRETYEETGIFVKKEDIHLFHVNSSPTSNRQNVVFSFSSFVNEPCDSFKLTADGSEENEVAELKWIPIADIDKYKWAFDHDVRIAELIKDNEKK